MNSNCNTDASYFAEKQSEHRHTRKEGYMLAVDVPFARTGYQSYHRSELRINDSEINNKLTQGMNEIYRPEKEVFDNVTMASFENVPITINHPPEMVNSSNWSKYAIGNVVNVRRGSGKYQDYLIGDFWIMDNRGVNIVDNKIQEEVSAGYNCDWALVDGKVAQVNIRGNHVAIVRNARAGHNARIGDESYQETSINYHNTIEVESELNLNDSTCVETDGEVINNININDNKIILKGSDKVEDNLTLKERVLKLFGLSDEEIKIASILTDEATDNKKVVVEKVVEEDPIDDEKSKKDDNMEDSKFKEIQDSIDELKETVAKLLEDSKEVVDESMVSKVEEANGDRGKSLEELYESLQSDGVKDTIPTELSPDGKLILERIYRPIAAIKDSSDRKIVSDEILAILKDSMVTSENTLDKVVEIVAENSHKNATPVGTVDTKKVQEYYDMANPHLNKEAK